LLSSITIQYCIKSKGIIMSENNEPATFRTETSFDRLSDIVDPVKILKMAQDLKEGKDAQRVGEMTYAVASAVIAGRADEVATDLINEVGKVVSSEGYRDPAVRASVENARHLREAAYNAREDALRSTLGTKITPIETKGVQVSREYQDKIASIGTTNKLLDSVNDAIELFARGGTDIQEIKAIAAISKSKADQLKVGVSQSIANLPSDDPIKLLAGIAVIDMNRLSTQCDNLKIY
jgi:hypothetical protein